jgi:hemicentin
LFQPVPAKIESSEVVSTPEVVLNQTITLFCPASGMPDPDVGWYLDNEIPITRNTTDIQVIDNGYRLRIERAQVSHAARYTCRAENIAGQAEKQYDLSVLGNNATDVNSSNIA